MTKESHLNPILDKVGFVSGRSAGGKNERRNGTGLQIDVENIIKVVQQDSVHHTYTFRIEDDLNKNSFSNFILQETGVGYLAYILQYESEELLTDVAIFTGVLRRYDMEGNLLGEQSLVNGELASETATNGRTQQEGDPCVTKVEVKSVCTKWDYIYNYQNTQTTGYGCVEYTTTTEITYGDCPTTDDYSWLTFGGGTYIYTNTNTGTGTSAGGSGGTGGSGSTGEDPIGGVTPYPVTTGVLTEDEAYQQRVTDFKSHLTFSELSYLKKNTAVSASIYSYLESQLDDNIQFPVNYSPSAIIFAKWAISYAIQHPDVAWDLTYFQRVFAVERLLEVDPSALIDIPCDQLPKWQAISTIKIPESVKDRLDLLESKTGGLIDLLSLNDDWELQELKDGKGTAVNMDEFSVTVTLPGSISPESVLEHIRLNLLTKLNGAKFTPHPNLPEETSKWNIPANSLGSILSIKMADDGSVICIQRNTNSWTFTTIEDPFNYAHPVSGNRQFGFEANSNGSFTFYTRGVDRMTNFVEGAVRDVGKFATDMDMLDLANPVWTSFQNLVADYAKNIGGSASINKPIVHRPRYDKLSKFLSGEISVNDLKNCN